MSAEQALAAVAEGSRAADYGCCPECGAKFLWSTAFSSEIAHQVISAIGRMPSRVAGWLPLYLGMFRNTSTGALPFAQQRTVLTQLEPMVVKERVDLLTPQGMLSKPASHAVWARGLETVVAARHKPGFSLPLLTNAYLLKTVYGLAEKQPALPAAVATASPSGPRADPAGEIAERYYSGAIPREQAEHALRQLGMDPMRIQIMIGAPA